MDMDLLLIMTMIVLVTGISFIGINGIVAKVLDYKREQRAHLAGASPRSGEIIDRTEMVEDRLRVLERLATDRGALLADEIEALRDDRAARTKEQELG